MRLLSVACLAVLVASASASGRVGNPWSTKATLHVQSGQAQLDPEEPDVGGTVTLTDDALVEKTFDTLPVNIANLKDFIKRRGATDAGLLNDLIKRSACIIRLEGDMGSSLSTEALKSYLTTRDKATANSIDEMLTVACVYQEREVAVRKLLSKEVGDITKDDLRNELTKLGFITTDGSKAELVDRLGKALLDLETIRHLTGDSDFDTSNVKDVLMSRGITTEGSTHQMLTRLAEYLIDISETAGIGSVSPHCDLVMGSSVCVEGGGFGHAGQAVPRGLVGKWTFDDGHGLDHSGKSNHLNAAPQAGPGLHGVGTSALFSGQDFSHAGSHAHIPHSEHFDSPDFCVTHWLYLEEDATGNWRVLLHKGNADHERTPTLFLEPNTRGVEFFVSTDATTEPAGERLWSNTFVPLRRWTHIAGCVEGRNMRLYINGLLDAENKTIGVPQVNQGPIYIGNDPWRQEGGTKCLIDELRYYTRALTTDEIQAQAHVALGGVEPAYTELGCMGCTYDSCPKACRRGYHMCTKRDVFGAAYTVARSMGWANSETRIWTTEDAESAGDTTQATGLCMCCRDDE